MLYDPNWKPPETEVKLEPWQQLMLKAADLIEQEGWVRRAYHIPDKGYCIMGAVRSFTPFADPPKSEFLEEDYNQVVQKLAASVPITTSIATWNDYVATKEQVIAKLREIARAE